MGLDPNSRLGLRVCKVILAAWDEMPRVEGEITRSDLDVTVAHEADCPQQWGEECACDPTVTVTPNPTEPLGTVH